MMRTILNSLSRKPNEMFSVIAPIDLRQPAYKLPYVYLDTTKSRRHLEATRGLVFKRPPPVPGRNWDFLYHDVTLVDDLVTFELTARRHGVPFGYESHHTLDGKRLYPKVSITHNNITATIRPDPDATLIFGDYHIILEHDCGEESIAATNVLRDATLGRKHLVYDRLERDGFFDRVGWQKRIKVYTVEGKRRTAQSSKKRVKSCIEAIPDVVDKQTIFFIDRQTFLDAGDNILQLSFMRGDGKMMPLPCFRRAQGWRNQLD